jgi:CHAD domain-containing protein/CYTH domain-containing protein
MENGPMSTPAPGDELLNYAVHRAARIIALRLLARVGDARTRLDDREDNEALHDFRVAVRRLRSWIRAFQPWLEESVTRRQRRRLRALARTTNAARDVEVHATWLAARYASLAPRQRVGARWLQQQLTAEVDSPDNAGSRAAVSERFERVFEPLRDSLSHYTLRVSVDGGPDEPRFAPVLAALLRQHAEALRALLNSLAGPSEADLVHRARIAGKRLRYLLEPIARIADGAAPLIGRLKSMQDALGDVNDANLLARRLAAALERSAAEQARALTHSVLEAEDEGAALRRARGRDARPGLLALARLVRRDAEEAFGRVRDSWLNGTSDAFFDDVDSVAAMLDQRFREGRELERKYLLSGVPPQMRDAPAVHIEQGYLPGRRLVERLRYSRGGDGERWVRNVKSGVGLSRLEVEEETSREVFGQLWPLTEGRRLTKRRYAIVEDTYVWEIDEFTDRDLVLAEVELPTEDAVPAMPAWLAGHVVREVTDEPEFSNERLAR